MENLDLIIEALLLSTAKALSVKEIADKLNNANVTLDNIREALYNLQQFYATRSIQLQEVSSGFRFQTNPQYAPWITTLLQEKPQRYSRAILETLAIIAYRQPVTRGDIEAIRGVSISTSTLKTLEDRNWVRVVGQRDVPGRPVLYATTKDFLDYFNLKNLEDLPSLPEILENKAQNLELEFNEIMEVSAAEEVAVT